MLVAKAKETQRERMEKNKESKGKPKETKGKTKTTATKSKQNNKTPYAEAKAKFLEKLLVLTRYSGWVASLKQ